ncbi:MAG: hypothetical protein A2Z37_07515 [Chloroflexi bacterium RBG_19FT_COMBO_62_14]|nr:MAG: hypothetical protein A2Z37_07515 [Chloroflexi bacterium RBG_19FT_COMBO_62_14]
MVSLVRDLPSLMGILFWSAAAFVADQAVQRRRLLRQAANYAPVTAGAAAAYIVGCFVGAALLAYLP